MDRKIIFCDVDGTLINHHGVMLESTREAIKGARANGHLVFICTGRSRAELVGKANELEVDGRICSAGGHVEIQDQIIRQEFMPVETIKHIIDFFKAHQIQFCLEAPDKTYVSEGTVEFFREITKRDIARHPENKESIQKQAEGFMGHMTSAESLEREDICKILYFNSKLTTEQLQAEFKDEVVILPNSMAYWGSGSGEIMMLDVHKATGIQHVLTYLGMNQKDTLGYGDSLNDMEMVQFVNIGIAMGNACDALKEVADEITETVDNEGIYKSFKLQGLLD
ncbi:Cof-type HAD-IIB family hydrolase [Cellulosilyticum ruminicola]|uniref:Cof-type HAD-IIB family hydrolase n=1 Tax=Cellulosilyticum ruminicola TaxID=425254 RepID=UPI0006D1EF48|nr:Cof-type HAD-IIB family hydrolase [Cellulosilyticum ruminicola]